MFIAGVDDAGRGCVIGPLVIAGVLVDEKGVKKLEKIGVKDSKILSPETRRRLYNCISNIAVKTYVIKIPPKEIDKVVFFGGKLRKLNWLEAKIMAEVISRLKPDIVYVDASDVSVERFKENIKCMLNFEVKIISEHNADTKYPIVSAASIIAKVERDREIEELREIYGDFGSGYPSDQRTINFLIEWIKIHREFPDFVRKSWKTAKEIISKYSRGKQTKLYGNEI